MLLIYQEAAEQSLTRIKQQEVTTLHNQIWIL